MVEIFVAQCKEYKQQIYYQIDGGSMHSIYPRQLWSEVSHKLIEYDEKRTLKFDESVKDHPDKDNLEKLVKMLNRGVKEK